MAIETDLPSLIYTIVQQLEKHKLPTSYDIVLAISILIAGSRRRDDIILTPFGLVWPDFDHAIDVLEATGSLVNANGQLVTIAKYQTNPKLVQSISYIINRPDMKKRIKNGTMKLLAEFTWLYNYDQIALVDDWFDPFDAIEKLELDLL